MTVPMSDNGRIARIPRMTDSGILIGDYAIAYRDGEFRTQPFLRHAIGEVEGREVIMVHTDYLFGRKFETELSDKDTPDSLKTYEITATLDNLRVLIQLPFLSEETIDLAMQLRLRFGQFLEKGCLNFIVNKSMTRLLPPESNPLGDARTPIRMKTQEKVEVRALTDKEKMRLAWGKPVPSIEERRVVTHQDVAEETLTEWRQFARGGYFPYSHQILGADLIYRIKRLMVWYDMRTGKTLTSMMAMQRLLEEGEIELLVVVCPRTNAYDPWEPELVRQGFNVVVLDGTLEEDEELIARRSKKFDRFYQRDLKGSDAPTVYVINYERVGSRLPMMYDHWVMSELGAILDETSLIKNPKSNRTRALHDMCSLPRAVVTLNGTPLEQGPQDVWAQAKCVDTYGVIWGRTFEEHAATWLVKVGPNTFIAKDKMRYEMLLATTSIRIVRSEADQFSGKDQSMRYVELTATESMVKQTENVGNGFVQIIAKEGVDDDILQEISKNKLAMYGFWREICCGYDKFREVEAGPYVRERHEVNPKVLWIQCMLRANPTTPLVIFCEFTEIEEWIKEMLDSEGVKWSSTKQRGKPTTLQRVHSDCPYDIRARCLHDLVEQQAALIKEHGEESEEVWDLPFNEEALRYHPAALNWFRKFAPDYLDTYYGHAEGKKHSPQERRRQTEAFNNGETHCFICKHSEARGISLHRKPAVLAGIGTWPDMIHTAPCWSLGMWDQSGDRCVTTDPRTKKNVCTMRWVLIVKGSIEAKIMAALRGKKNVQAELQRDLARQGYSNFVQDLVTGMVSTQHEDDKETQYFDTDEMQARIYAGVPPYSKLTDSLVLNKLTDLLVHRKIIATKNKKEAVRWLESCPVGEHDSYSSNEDQNIRVAVTFLLGRSKKES